jgi:hypothetical protein
VDAVEVDPVLTYFGHVMHPQRPYADARVRAINDDARAFLRRSSETYDMIVMNALDSHHQLPGLSTLRLESYIYTVQAFEDVRRHMHPDSVFVVQLSSSRPWMGERLYWSLTEAFGREPALFTTPGSPFQSIAFVFGPERLLHAARGPASGLLGGPPDPFDAARATTALATDDWPHLYLANRFIPQLYYQVLGFVILLTILCFGGLNHILMRGASAPTRGTKLLHFALLGASFMLLQTRAITQFALLFGSTWIVNAIVITSILCVILIGNRLMQQCGEMSNATKCAVYVGILMSLVSLYFIPLDALLPFNLFWRVVLAGLVIGTPIFGASLIFSDSFRRAPHASAAFGANLVGVVVGGALEYSSMQFGLKFLYLVAAIMYSLAWLAERYGRVESPTPAEPRPAAAHE